MFSTTTSRTTKTLIATLALGVSLTACGPHDLENVRSLDDVAERSVDARPAGGFTTPAPTPRPEGPTEVATPTVAGHAIPGPEVGRPLIIVGVDTDDVLNFRIAPSPNAAIATAYPLTLTELDMYTLGEAWAAPSGVWWKVNVMGTEAWAHLDYLAVRGGSVPVFDEVAQDLQILTSASPEELALDVAASRASTSPASRITIVTEPEILPLGDGGGIGTVFVDVLDFDDDNKKGERLAIDFQVVFDLDTPEPDDIAFVVLTGVEMIYLQGH